MSLFRRRLASFSLLVALFAPWTSLGTATTPVPRQEDSTIARYPVEVRLRKLHMVRPDLIPYPLAIEIYC